MNRISLLIILVLAALAPSCNKDEADFRMPELETPVITGYQMRDAAAQPMGNIGRPNIKLGHPSGTWDSEYFITFFPNPAINFAALYMKSPNEYDVKKVWLTQAVFQPPFAIPGISMDGMNNLIAGGAPLLQGEVTGSSLMLDLRDIPTGYYRLYVSVNGHIFYDNVVIDKDFIPYN